VYYYGVCGGERRIEGGVSKRYVGMVYLYIATTIAIKKSPHQKEHPPYACIAKNYTISACKYIYKLVYPDRCRRRSHTIGQRTIA